MVSTIREAEAGSAGSGLPSLNNSSPLETGVALCLVPEQVWVDSGLECEPTKEVAGVGSGCRVCIGKVCVGWTMVQGIVCLWEEPLPRVSRVPGIRTSHTENKRQLILMVGWGESSQWEGFVGF